MLGRPVPGKPDGKRDARSVPPKVVSHRVGCIVSACDTPRRALPWRCAKGVAEQELARHAPRVCGLNGNGRLLAALRPCGGNCLVAEERWVSGCRPAMDFGKAEDVNEAWLRCEQRNDYQHRDNSSVPRMHGVTPNAQAHPRICRSEAEANTSGAAPCWTELRSTAYSDNE